MQESWHDLRKGLAFGFGKDVALSLDVAVQPEKCAEYGCSPRGTRFGRLRVLANGWLLEVHLGA